MTNDIFLCGDFNIDMSRTNDTNILYFIDSINSVGLFPLINKPTRIGDYYNTIIDNILTNCKTSPEIICLFITDISDHLPIFSIYNNLFTSNLILTKQKYITFRSSNYSNINYLKKSLLDYNWKYIYDDNNPNSAFESFFKIYTDFYFKHCPLIKKKTSNCVNKPWIPEKNLKCIA